MHWKADTVMKQVNKVVTEYSEAAKSLLINMQFIVNTVHALHLNSFAVHLNSLFTPREKRPMTERHLATMSHVIVNSKDPPTTSIRSAYAL